MDQPLVSIIINNYNYAKFLGQAIDSALGQTYLNIEVIVVDDGSTDNSVQLIASYGTQIIPVLKNNGGQASTMNAGFAISRGEIVIFLDSDDYLFPHAVEQVVAAWKPGVAKVQYRLELVDTYGNRIDLFPAPEISLDSGEVLPILLERGRYETLVTSGNAFTRSVLNKILPIPEVEFRLGSDGYLVTMAPFYGQVVSLEHPLGGYRRHGSNDSGISDTARGGVRVKKLHWLIEHDFQRYKALSAKATELGHTVSLDLGFRDAYHLSNRIASLRLEPQNHPVTSDSPLFLAYKGYWAIWKYSKFNLKRKFILSTWFLWVGIMPQALAKPAIKWVMASESRPKIIDSTIKKIRALTSK